MKVIVDNKIPYIKGILEPCAEVEYLSPEEITAPKVQNADALIIRTRTRCDVSLLKGSRCRFIATATIGYDHIDTEYCRDQNIFWTNAPGCNASSVAQYVVASLLLTVDGIAHELAGKTIGIVGVGNVGKAVERQCRILGMNVLRNDPPREMAEHTGDFVSLEQIAAQSDYITFHTPLTGEGDFKTYHLADDNFFESLQRKPFIVNSARGEVVSTSAILAALEKNKIAGAIMDCWENEPHISPLLLEKSILATPHIAGYSADGKFNATKMSLASFSKFFDLNIDMEKMSIPAPDFPELDLSFFSPDRQISAAVHCSYNPLLDTMNLRSQPSNFEQLRSQYMLRREYPAYSLYGCAPQNKETLRALGFILQ